MVVNYPVRVEPRFVLLARRKAVSVNVVVWTSSTRHGPAVSLAMDAASTGRTALLHMVVKSCDFLRGTVLLVTP